MSQKKGMKGDKGGWKVFLLVHDKKMGTSISDLVRRSKDDLVAFLNTFSDGDDLKVFTKVMQCQANREVVETLSDSSTSYQKLVDLTIRHPDYPFNYSFPSHEEEWLIIKVGKLSKAKKSNSMVAVDCEMVLCEDGTEALVQVCAVDPSLEVKLNELVKPNKVIADYRTEITGITADDLEKVTCSLANIQKSMRRLLSHGTILVGHSLNSDLEALKLNHARVVDTSFIFKSIDAQARKRPSLNDLCKTVLGYELRKPDAPHNCLEDARAAMKLALAKLEHGFENDIAWTPKAVDVQKKVPEDGLARLLIHRIPTSIHREDLRNIFPQDITFELQPSSRARRQQYSVVAVFNNLKETNKAFDCLKSNVKKDSHGNPQKPVRLKSGTDIIFVRKMHSNNHPEKHSPPLNKRALQVDDTVESKKPKVDLDQDQCDHVQEIESQNKELQQGAVEIKALQNQCGHIEEIERLHKELQQRDAEIKSLQTIISALKRKQRV